MIKVLIKTIYTSLMILLFVNTFLNIIDVDIAIFYMSSMLLIASIIALINRKKYENKAIIAIGIFCTICILARLILRNQGIRYPFIPSEFGTTEILFIPIFLGVIATALELELKPKEYDDERIKKYSLLISGLISIVTIILLIFYLNLIKECFNGNYDTLDILAYTALIQSFGVVVLSCSRKINPSLDSKLSNRKYILFNAIIMLLEVFQYKYNFMNNIVLCVILFIFIVDKKIDVIVRTIFYLFKELFIHKHDKFEPQNRDDEIRNAKGLHSVKNKSYVMQNICQGIDECPMCKKIIGSDDVICTK